MCLFLLLRNVLTIILDIDFFPFVYENFASCLRMPNLSNHLRSMVVGMHSVGVRQKEIARSLIFTETKLEIHLEDLQILDRFQNHPEAAEDAAKHA